MSPNNIDHGFAGSIPLIYEQYLVPLIFEPYATDLTARVVELKPSRVLEIAAGTGAVTRQLASALPPATSIIATDLNQPMLDQAAATGTSRAVEWRQADATQLPFSNGMFDVVVCQFGIMFFPDKPKTFAETKRVLRPGGVFIFNVWDRIEENDFAKTVTMALGNMFPNDPPKFMERIPHSYHDRDVIADDLARGGFDKRPKFTTVAARSRAESARVPAIGYCQGTPLRSEIEARDPQGLVKATETVKVAIADRFGNGAIEGKIQALVVAVER